MFSLALAGENLHAFYSWTRDFSQIGWFLAKEKPPAGHPVTYQNPGAHKFELGLKTYFVLADSFPVYSGGKLTRVPFALDCVTSKK